MKIDTTQKNNAFITTTTTIITTTTTISHQLHTTIYVGLLLLLFSACQKKELPSLSLQGTEEGISPTSYAKCDQSEEVKERYYEDAARLALKLYQLEETGNAPSILIPNNYIARVMDALMAVYNAKQLAARDSVVEHYPVHTFPEPVLNRLLVGLDANYAWTRAWLTGKQETNNFLIDDLITKYNLWISTYDPTFGYVQLESDNMLNISILARTLSDIPGVDYTEQDGVWGDGTDIDIRPNSDNTGLTLTYSVGYGNCKADCTYRHYWQFEVSNDCEVAYTGSFGDPAP